MNVTPRNRAPRRAPLASVEDLAASIAHEVNQPLAAIVVNAECCLLWLRKEQPDLDMARQAAERIVRNGQHASEVIRSVRAMLGNTNELALVDLDAVVADTLELIALDIANCRVVLEVRRSTNPVTVRCDATQIRRVLLNLLRNALESICSVTGIPRTLQVSITLVDTQEVAVAIADSGPGLDPATAKRIFEPFFTTKSDGMGLGLAICRSIIESHGGRLSMQPRQPHGCTFEFTLPVHGRR